MNARKAKKLRKQAEQENIGTIKEYQRHQKSACEKDGVRYCGTLELKNCTRKVYKQLKQEG